MPRKLAPRRTAAALVVLAGCISCFGADWLRPGINTTQPVWGIKGGLEWAIFPGGFPPPGGPRGLIRIGFPTSSNGPYQLDNFIAVEPVVHGNRGLSELEFSQLDRAHGKHIRPVNWTNATARIAPGKLTTLSNGVEELAVTLDVEKFNNGAHVHIVVAQRSDQPDEISLTVHKMADGEPLEYCILTATMGNKARLRQLWLKDQTAISLHLFANYTGDGFAPHHIFPLEKLRRTESGDVYVAATTDEKDPASVFPFPGTRHWHFDGEKLTQYWKQPAADVRPDLACAVNGRYTYWQSRQRVPGGVAFENFELREKFYEGQRFVFGITTNSPNSAQ